MAKRRDIAAYVLQNFTLGELQKGIYMPREVMTEDSDGRTIHKTVLRPVKGTGIPASTISRMLLPQNHPKYLQPRKTTLDKFRRFYERFAYNAVRSQGTGQQEAQKARRIDPSKLDAKLEVFRNTAKTISQNKNIPLPYIISGMSISNKYKSSKDWENYLKDKKFTPLTIKEIIQTSKEVAFFPQKISKITQKVRKYGRKAKRRSKTKTKRK